MSVDSLPAVTADTLAALKGEVLKAQTQGYTTATGLTGYELEAPAKSLFPVLSPFRNRVPRRKAPVGAPASNWKAITGINVGNLNPFVAFGVAGNRVTTVEQDYVAAYKAIALDDQVQMDAQALARGFDDLRARSGTNLLYALMIAEDKILLGGQNIALPTVAAPTLTQADTGGSIAASTAVHVVAVARTLENYFYGGGTVTSADATVTTSTVAAATHSVSATVASVRGAVAYDWYVGASNTAYYYYGTSVVNAVTITSLPTADATNPTLLGSGSVSGAAAARAGAGTNVRSTFTDSSADSNAFNGLLATITQDYNGSSGQVTAGSGTASGAYIKSLDGATLTGSNGGVTEIDDMLQSLWDSSRISPTALFCNAQQHRDVTRKVISTFGASTLFDPNNIEERRGAVGGVYMKTYLNPAVNGQPIELVTMPHIPQGTIVAVSEVLPYPSTNVESVFEVETQQEYQQIEYPAARGADGAAMSGPRYDLEVRAIETLKNQFPAGCAVLQNVGKG